jgi:hypothetical protein
MKRAKPDSGESLTNGQKEEDDGPCRLAGVFLLLVK